MYSQKIRLFSLNLVLVMLFTLIPVQAADIVIDDDGPLYTVVLDGNGGTYGDEGQETLSVSYGNSPLYLEDYIFTKEGCTLLGWRESADENAATLDYTRFDSIYGGSKGEDTRTLYAVWGEGENRALYDLPIEDASQLGKYWVLNATALPEVTDSDFIGWYDHLRGVCMSGEAVKAGEVYSSLYSSDDPIVLDGNGGTSNFGGELFFCGSKRSGYSFSGDRPFHKDGFILDGWVASPDSDMIVATGEKLFQSDLPADSGLITLYAHWSQAYRLTDGARLVINGNERNELLQDNVAVNGNGWRFSPGGRLDLYGLHSDADYKSFAGIAYDGNCDLSFDGNVATGQIETNGRLGIQSRGSNASAISVETTGIPAIHAESVELIGSDASYQISAANAVGVDASYIYLGSPNITITGDPAVRADAKIVCHSSGIGYKISEDRTTLTTYAIDQSITLDGNGGTFDGKESVTVPYSVNDPIDLSQYAFTRTGYELIGWAGDTEGSSYFRDRYSGNQYVGGQETLYAIWLEVPENADYAIFRCWAGDTISDAYGPVFNGRGYYCMEIKDGFTMPEIETGSENKVVIWRNADNDNIYFGGERFAPSSGTWFDEKLYDASDECHVIVLDGNGGTYRYTSSGKTYNVNREVVASGVSNGQTVNYAYNFTRPGYTLVSYNSEPDGSGTEYALNKCTVTADMEPLQILYAQWKAVSADEPYISIDGVMYRADRSRTESGWRYDAESNPKHLYLTGYQGGSIEANVDLWVTSAVDNTVTGSISAPNLTVALYKSGSLTVTSTEGSALRAAGELNINCDGAGTFEASGTPAALSYGELIKDGYQTYLIRGGADKANAELITNDTYGDLPYISYERRDRVLTLHGNGGTTADGKYIYTVSSKDSIIDLTAYAETFTNGDKRLLGWSRQADASTIDYAAASDVSYSFDYWYGFEGDLYAVWEDDDRKGIVLNDYGYFTGQRYENNGSTLESYRYAQQYTLPVSGETFALPESYRAGYAFTGWLGSDGSTYQAGTEIKIPTALSFTAQYTVGSITVGGKEYSADQVQGGKNLGWTYEPGYTRYPSGYSTLRIYENYSGAPIRADGNLHVIFSTDNDLTATAGQPMIDVDGNLWLQTDSYAYYGETRPYAPQLTGGAGAPAVKAAGTLHLSDPVTLVGGDGAPAMQVKALDAGVAFLTGTSEAAAERAGTYKNEHYFRMDLAAPATFQPGNLIPQMPDTETHRFVGWRESTSGGMVWYLPADTVEETEKTMSVCYISKDMRALILNGNGGTASNDQNCLVMISSDSDLRLTAETAQSAFRRDGYALAGYNTDRDGDGTGYTAQQLAALVSGTAAAGVQTFYAQWRRTGDMPVTPGEPSQPTQPTQPTQTTTPDGSTDYTVSGSTATIENVDVDKLVTDTGEKKTAEIDLSDARSGITDVTLPSDAVKQVAASDAETLTVKLPDVTVSFDDKALAAVADQSSGTDLSLSVNVGTSNSLTDAQKNAITGANELSVIEVSLSSNGEKISNFNGGSVTIDVPFQWSMKGLLRAYYIDEDGNKSAIDVTYKNGVASLVLKHFSTYVLEVVDALPFSDVSANDYYFDAVSWALKSKITEGQSDTAFAPNASCTRAQMVTFLWRANGSPAPKTTEMPFTDVSADAYYYNAVLWAVENGVTTGTGETAFSPDHVISRAEAVTFLWRTAGKPIAEGSLFADVESTKYYAEAVRWAVTGGITNGMSDSTFAPNNVCTRAHIVTFLYRAYRSK